MSTKWEGWNVFKQKHVHFKDHWQPFLSHVYVKVGVSDTIDAEYRPKNIGLTHYTCVFTRAICLFPKHIIFAGPLWLVRVRISLTFQLHCHSHRMFWSQSSLWIPLRNSELSRHKLFLFSLLENTVAVAKMRMSPSLSSENLVKSHGSQLLSRLS